MSLIVRFCRLLLFVWFCTPGLCAQDAAVPDTIRSVRLNDVTIEANRPSRFKSTAPLQVLQGKELQRLNALQVSDALKYFSGVQVKDYGGVGGLKTVSVRSLGANYTAVAYDGIILTDYQTGQIDLGRFSLDNVERISLNTGDNDDIFQPARVLAAAGAIQIVTRTPDPNMEKKTAWKLGLKGGSLEYFNPLLVVDRTLSRTFSAQFSAEWMKTKGDYPYTQFYGTSKDSSSRKSRINSDVETLKLEANLHGRFKNGGKLAFKLYGYDSNRGIPGPAVYYLDHSDDRATDQNYFSQLHYVQPLNKKIDFQANARFGFSHSDYCAIDSIYPEGKLENRYFQREYYLNATFRYRYNERLSMAWANDGSVGNFSNNFKDCAFPSRTTWQSALTGKYEHPRFTLTGGFSGIYTDESVRTGPAPGDLFRLSPSIGFSVLPFQQLPLRIRGFYKNTFRLPTFGDLYYSRVPSAPLKPENAHQINTGFLWTSKINTLLPYLSFSIDGYWNKINNKIVAYPKSNMYIWSVQNLGKVDIKGMDCNLDLHIQSGRHLLWQLGGSYTYQNVLDKTDPESGVYNQQLAYTPHHSGSGRMTLTFRSIDVNYTVLYCGERYYERINRPEFLMDAYTEQGASIAAKFKQLGIQWRVTAECSNILDAQYEVVRSYPMPGRLFRIGVKAEF